MLKCILYGIGCHYIFETLQFSVRFHCWCILISVPSLLSIYSVIFIINWYLFWHYCLRLLNVFLLCHVFYFSHYLQQNDVQQTSVHFEWLLLNNILLNGINKMLQLLSVVYQDCRNGSSCSISYLQVLAYWYYYDLIQGFITISYCQLVLLVSTLWF